MSKIQWVSTSDAVNALKVSQWTLYNTIRPKLKNTRSTKYWKSVNPNARRKTYRWNIKAIEEFQAKEEEV